MIKNLFIGILLITAALNFASCSKDDDPQNSDSEKASFTINGTKVSEMFYTLCEVSYSPKEVVFEANFKYDNDTYSLDLALPSIKSLDEIKAGDKYDADDFTVYKFYSMSGAFVGSKDYWPTDGTVTIQAVSSKNVVLKFSKFSFVRELGNKQEEFTVNGTISYSIYE